MYLGHNIKLIRKRWGLQQEAFADLMNSKKGRISNYEANPQIKMDNSKSTFSSKRVKTRIGHVKIIGYGI